MTSGTYLMIALAVLTTSPVATLGIGWLFGIVRGLAAVLAARRITSPDSLRAFTDGSTPSGPSRAAG